MDEMEIDPEIAAAMGFTSFGASNKRKFTGTSDSYVEGQDSSNNKRKNQNATFGTGANDAPLGTRTTSTNDADAQMMDAASKDEDTTATINTNNKTKDKKNKKKGGALGLADYISWGNSVPEDKPTQQTETPAVVLTTNPPTSTALVATAAQQENTTSPSNWSQGMPSHEELAALRRGVRNARGDTAYFLPSFIQDPWDGLEG